MLTLTQDVIKLDFNINSAGTLTERQIPHEHRALVIVLQENIVE